MSLVGLAAVAAFLAALVAWASGLTFKEAGADALLALLTAVAVMVVAVTFFALSYPLDSAPWWREAGAGTLLAGPIAATAALRLRSRRSSPRALLGSGLALAAVVLWLTVHLKGPRGGWSGWEVVGATAGAAATVAFGACLGWWSKRTPRRGPSQSMADRAL